MRQKNYDLLLIMIYVALNVLWAVLPVHLPVIGIILALPLVFFIPGYVLNEVFFSRRIMEGYHLLVVSLTLSLAIVILGGFVLNLLPGGLNAVSWSLFLGIFTTVFTMIEALLRQKIQKQITPTRRVHLALHEYLLFLLSRIILIVSIGYSSISITYQPRAGFTQLWMVPSQNTANTWTVDLGIQSKELTTTRYQLTMSVNGTVVKTWSAIALAPDSAWRQQLPLPMDSKGKMYVQARLALVDKPGVIYREVHVTLIPNTTGAIGLTGTHISSLNI